MSEKAAKKDRKEMLGILEEAGKRNEAFQKELHALCTEYGKDMQAGVQACLVFVDVGETPADPVKNKEFSEKLREMCLKHEMQPEARMQHTSQGSLPTVIVVDHRAPTDLGEQK